MSVTAIDILVKKGRLELPVAVAIADAIQMITRNEQLVTLPVLDSRLETLEARIDAKMEKRFKEVDARFQEIRLELQKSKFQQILWTLIIVIGNSQLPHITSALTRALAAVTF